MSWEGLGGVGVHWVPSAVESSRFGLSVARASVGYDTVDADAAASELMRALTQADDDLVIVRYPSHLTRIGAAVGASGRWIIPADVLMYWEVPTATLTPDADGAAALGLSVRRPEAADAAGRAALRTVVEDSFRGYGNHYTANPRLDPELALAGYLEWADRSFVANPDDVVLLEHDGTAVGVATLEASSDGRDLEILLAGLTGTTQGQGWYAHLLGGVGAEAARRGCARVVISTQAHNVRVQRAWTRAGFKPYAAVTTVHAMARAR